MPYSSFRKTFRKNKSCPFWAGGSTELGTINTDTDTTSNTGESSAGRCLVSSQLHKQLLHTTVYPRPVLNMLQLKRSRAAWALSSEVSSPFDVGTRNWRILSFVVSPFFKSWSVINQCWWRLHSRTANICERLWLNHVSIYEEMHCAISSALPVGIPQLSLATRSIILIMRSETHWKCLNFIVSFLQPDENSLDFSSCMLRPGIKNAQDLACGVCLLNVDSRSKVSVWPLSLNSFLFIVLASI